MDGPVCGARDSVVPKMGTEEVGLGKCRDVCLFCLKDIRSGMAATALENVVPFGPALTLRLDDPAKNVEMFDFLCSMLNLKWVVHGGEKFDKRKCLPLCSECLNLYQDCYQVRVQIRELGKVLKEQIELVRCIIKDSERRTEELDKTKLKVYGLDYFRERVLRCGNEAGRPDRSTNTCADPDQNKKANADQSLLETSEDQHPILPLKTEFLYFSNEEVGNECDIPFEEIEMEHLQDFESKMSPGERSSFEDNSSEETSKNGSSRRTSKRPRLLEPLDSRSQNDAERNDQSIDSDSDFAPDEDDNDDEDYLGSESKRKRTPTKRKSIGVKRRVPASSKTFNHLPRKAASNSDLLCHLCEESITDGRHALFQHYKDCHPNEKRYTCKYCERHFPKLSEVRQHQFQHNREKPFECQYCKKRFTTTKARNNHQTFFHEGTGSRFACKLCGKEFPKLSLLKVHEETHSQATVFCKICGKQYRSQGSFKKHNDNVHEGIAECTAPMLNPTEEELKALGITVSEDAKNSKEALICHICDENIFGRQAFRQHYIEQHPEENRYTCKFCGQHFQRCTEVRYHQQQHTGDKPHSCKYCSKKFTTKKSLKNHEKFFHERTGVRFSCEICEREFPKLSILKVHQIVHNEDVILCKTCGQSCKSETIFKRHNKRCHNDTAECTNPIRNPTDEDMEALGIEVDKRIVCHVCWKHIQGRNNIKKHFDEFHESQSPLTCATCGKQFSNFRETRKHAMRHAGNKTIHCDKCPMTFFTKTELRNHNITHLSDAEKPKFVCEICGISFAIKGRLTMHYKTHEGNMPRWVCEICGKSYSDRKGYRHHQKSVHLNATPHKCPECPKAFVGPGELERHVRVHTKHKPFKCSLCDKRFPYTNSRSRHVREVHYKNNYRNRGPKKLNKQEENVPISYDLQLDSTPIITTVLKPENIIQTSVMDASAAAASKPELVEIDGIATNIHSIHVISHFSAEHHYPSSDYKPNP